MTITIDIPGKPKPKTRPRVVRTNTYTPSSEAEKAAATYMLAFQGRYAGKVGLSVSCWFYGANKQSDGDNLLKLVVDALVKARVIDDDNIGVLCHASYEARDQTHESNPFPDQPGTRVRVGSWE